MTKPQPWFTLIFHDSMLRIARFHASDLDEARDIADALMRSDRFDPDDDNNWSLIEGYKMIHSLDEEAATRVRRAARKAKGKQTLRSRR